MRDKKIAVALIAVIILLALPISAEGITGNTSTSITLTAKLDSLAFNATSAFTGFGAGGTLAINEFNNSLYQGRLGILGLNTVILPVCGSNGCESGETCSSCSQDCGQCSSSGGGGGSSPPSPAVVAPVVAPTEEPKAEVPTEQQAKSEEKSAPAEPAAVAKEEQPEQEATEAAVQAPAVIESPVVIPKAGSSDAVEENKVTLKESESIAINIDGKEYTLGIDKINFISAIGMNSVEIIIQNKYEKLILGIGETRYVDFDNDGTYDHSITLLEVTETQNGRQSTLIITDLKTRKTLINRLFSLFKKDTAAAIEDAAACININKTEKSKAAQEKVEIRQTALDAKTVLPKGLDLAVQPFALNCQGSTVSLALNIPNNVVDLQALRCRNRICRDISVETLSELKCGDKIKEQIREETFVPKIIEVNADINETYSAKNRVNILGMGNEGISAKITIPEEKIAQPENPNLKIISQPINIEFNSLKDNLDAEIIMPYVTDPQADKNSISIYARDTYLNTWEQLESRINASERTVTAVIRNASQYLIKKELTDNKSQRVRQVFTGGFALIGTICTNCEFSAFENIYFPAEASKATVILVHGLGSTPATYNAIINDIRLTKQPWQAWTFGYPSNRPSLDNGIELADNIERYNKEFQDIYIVAHSLGGLVVQKALNYAYEHNRANASAYTFINKTKKAVLIGVPNDKVAGSELFKQLFKYTVNVRTKASLFDPESVGIKELAYGQVIPKVPTVEYLVIAGTKPYVIETALFTVRSDELFGLNESNDGIVTITGAQHVGEEYVNNRCENYWEIPETHTELIKNPTARQIIEGIISREISTDIKNKAILGKNKYIELTIPDCSSEDKYAVVGKKIAEEKVADASGCSCGNGFCGQDEDKISCPSDCANIIRKETVCSSSFFSIILAGLLLAIAGVVASVYLINAERVKLTALIRKLCMLLVLLLLPAAWLNLFICGKTVMKISAEIILITIFTALFFALKKKPKTEAAIKETQEKVLLQQPSERRNAVLKFLIKIAEVIIEENKIFFLKLFYSKEKFSEIMEMQKTARENRLLEEKMLRLEKINADRQRQLEAYAAQQRILELQQESIKLEKRLEELEKIKQQQHMLREKRLHSLEHAREARLKHIYERKAAEEIEKNRQQQHVLREKRLYSLEYAREAILKQIYERKTAKKQKKAHNNPNSIDKNKGAR